MEHHFLEMRSLIKTSLRFIMKFPGEERSLIKTYLSSLIKTDFMEQPSAIFVIKATTDVNHYLQDGPGRARKG